MDKKSCLIGCGLLAAFSLISVISVLVWFSIGPEGGVRLPNEMEGYALEYMTSHELIDGDEALLAYYDVTISLDGSEAVILTTDRVVYHKNGKDSFIKLVDIKDIRHRKETLIGDVFEVEPRSGQTMKIEVAPFNSAETFKNVLFAEWEKVRNIDKK